MQRWRTYAGSVARWQKSVRRQAIDALLPPRCPISDEQINRQGGIAPSVWRKLNFLTPPWCGACGVPFSSLIDAAPLCVVCTAPLKSAGRITGPHALDRVRAAVSYDDTIAKGVLRLKYSDRTDGVAAFSQMMASVGRDIWATGPEPILVPVPLHRRRLLSRRYNQAALLAHGVGRVASVPVAATALRRIRATPPQKGGSRSERARNVSGAFAIDRPVDFSGRHVVLIDDVLTTGATLLACARILRQGGAAMVSAITMARVIPSAPDTTYVDEAEGLMFDEAL